MSAMPGSRTRLVASEESVMLSTDRAMEAVTESTV